MYDTNDPGKLAARQTWPESCFHHGVDTRSRNQARAVSGLLTAFSLFGCNAVLNPVEGGEFANEVANADSSGDDGGGGAEAIDAPNPALCEIAPAQMRMLSHEEYDNTVRDLLGTTQSFGFTFPGEAVVGGFDNNAAALSANARLVEEYSNAADALSAEAVSDLERLVPCPASEGRSCAQRFIDEFGTRAFRRPLTAAEGQRYMSTFESGEEFGFDAGIEFVVNAMLQSPNFVYRTESVDENGRYDAYSLASRLSYFLWNSMPDDELLEAARAGALDDDESLRAQVDRMIQDDRVRLSLRNFVRQWLHLDELDLLTKNPELYPEYKPEMRSLWEEQLYLFAEHAVFSAGGLDALMTGSFTFVNDELASLYGLPAPQSSELTFTDASTSPGTGVLGQPGLMALHAHDLPSIYRGKFVLAEMLCSAPPPPPDELEIPVVEGDFSLRDYTDELTMGPGCASCHSAINPYGHALGEFDGLGRYTTTDSYGFSVDSTTDILLGRETVTVDSAAGLSQTLLESPELRGCFVRKWYRYATGRLESTADACAVDSLARGFDGDIQGLLASIATHESFTHGVMP